MLIHEGRSTLLELFPIKLVGGFIALDQHAGCQGCTFCLSRRHLLWPKVYKHNWHYDSLFDSPEQAKSILNEMRSFRQARVPVRFGHNTDCAYQWDFGVSLYRMMPPEQPFIFMTRHPVPEEHLSLFDRQANLLLKLTITPPSRLLGIHPDVEALVRTARSVCPDNLYVLVGPVTEDNYTAVPFIIDKLFPGTWVDIKPLTCSGIPGMKWVRPADRKIIDTLRDSAFYRGMTVTDYFGCLLRRRLHRPFYKAGEAAKYIRRSCRWCEQRDLCYRDQRSAPRIDEIRCHAKSIGLTLGEVKELGHRVLHFECEQPTSRGDETFLSEMTGHRVHLSSVPCGSEGGSFDQTPDEILERWEAYAMLPTSRLIPLAERAVNAWECTTQTESTRND